nr:MAG TPA: hypothetical protein [Caudoviricetes sp.]
MAQKMHKMFHVKHFRPHRSSVSRRRRRIAGPSDCRGGAEVR